MNSAYHYLFDAILRSTLALGIAALIVRGLLLWIKPSSPRWHQAAWALVMLQGVIFLHYSVAIPWFPTDNTKNISFDSVHQENLNATPVNPTTNPSPVILTNSDLELVTRFNWFSLAASIWITGCGLIVLWWISAYIISAKRLRHSEPATETWAREWQAVLKQYDIRKPIPLHITHDAGPMLCLLLRGFRVFVPRQLWSDLTETERLAILHHELAHLWHGDIWKGFLARLVVCLHWFNPLAWWTLNKLDECAELLCDDEVLNNNPDAIADYARALFRIGSDSHQIHSPASAARGGKLYHRIRRILSPAPPERSMMKRTLLLLVPLLLLAINLFDFQLVAEEKTIQPESAPRQVAFAPPVTNEPREKMLTLSKEERFKYLSGTGLNIYEWDAGNLKLKSRGFGDQPSSLFSVVPVLTGLQPVDLDGNSRLWVNTKLGGDFIIRKGTSTEAIIEDLGSMLNHDLKLQVSLEFKKVDREVYVARGTFQPAPIGPAWRRPEDKSYLIYGKEGPEPDKLHFAESAGKFPDFLKAIGYRVGRPVLSEIKNPPQGSIGWRIYFDQSEHTTWENFPRNFAKNTQLVLQHVSEQTGLTFHEENREVRLLFLQDLGN
ncbi:BlaR1 peptidase M56 [Gimesia alba]|uniref:BlaR1 peptidase M56 n=1 Tax=Gimesia alba TaxID=2527973 RepID=A0A517RIE7_9PLAN|nr:M56 family metallopeptidase [Gimesia alba]QDT43642.1 BlaR1 peptidase M56 [Gimesia alba]